MKLILRETKRKIRGIKRQWEDLDEDCLIEIFKKVRLKPLALDLPFVCKPWYKATKQIDLMKYVYSMELSHKGSNSCRCTLTGRSSSLRCLISEKELPPLVTKLVNLESLDWKCSKASPQIDQLLKEISDQCKKFVNLHIDSYTTQISAILNLPKLKCLRLTNCFHERLDLKHIISERRELEELDISGCEGCCYEFYFEDDEEIMEMGSRIKIFKCAGASFYDEETDYFRHKDCSYYRPLSKGWVYE